MGKSWRSREDRELVRAYAYRSAAPSTLWARLVDGARDDLLFAGYTNYFFWTMVPDFAGVLRRKVATGCRVRFLLGDPESAVTRQREALEDVELTVSMRIRMTLRELSKLGDVDGISVRYVSEHDATAHVSSSVFVFDEQALVTPHLALGMGHDSPMLHLRRRRRGDGGLFDRFALHHAEVLWERGMPTAPGAGT